MVFIIKYDLWVIYRCYISFTTLTNTLLLFETVINASTNTQKPSKINLKMENIFTTIWNEKHCSHYVLVPCLAHAFENILTVSIMSTSV